MKYNKLECARPRLDIFTKSASESFVDMFLFNRI